MSSSYLCGTMSFLTEKEALETWSSCELFTAVLPPDATPHSFDYIRRMVTESKRREELQRKQQQQNQEQQQRQEGEQDLDDDDDHHHHLDASHQQKDYHDEEQTKKNENNNLVFELATADEATLDMIVQEEENETKETIRRQKALVDGEGVEGDLDDDY